MTSGKVQHGALLLVANYDSDVGYAWWLMESFWVALANRYADQANVLLAYPSISKVPSAIATAPIELTVANFMGGSLGTVRAQLRLITDRRVRVMYLTDAPSLSWRYPLYRLAGVRRIVVHDHTPGRRTVPGPVKLLMKRILHRLPWLAADAMIGATPFVTRRHRDVVGFPPHRCFTAANGLPPSKSGERLNVHATFGIPAHRRAMVAVSRAHHIKGIELVLDAIAELVITQGRRDLHFLFCGDGPHLDDFRAKAAALQIAEFVTFAGRRTDIMPILRGCDLAIHPSLAEVGYSLSILECMQAALPIVVSDDESVAGATVDGQTALHFRSGDALSAAAKITELLDDRVRAEAMAVNAHAVVCSQYHLDTTHAALLEAMERAMGGNIWPSPQVHPPD